MAAELLNSVRSNWIRRYTIYNLIPFVFNGLLILWGEINSAVHAWEFIAAVILYAALYLWYRRWAYGKFVVELETRSISFQNLKDFRSTSQFVKKLASLVNTSRILYWDAIFFAIHILFGLSMILFMMRTM